MEDPKPEVKETADIEQTEGTSDQVKGATEQDSDSVDDLKQRLFNAQKENERKALELQRLREETQAKAESYNVNDLNTWKDHELRAVSKDPQYAHLHDKAEQILSRRITKRILAEEREVELRTKAELERQKLYPETFAPGHPMELRMREIIAENRLESTPASYLVAAKLAAHEQAAKKAAMAGRKQEQNRQADVNANFGGGNRPAPVSNVDAVKMEELKKRAQAGDPEAKKAWFKARGLI